MTNLAGKRILVTGGTTGIGRETVKQLVARGAHVITFGRDQGPLDEVLEQARAGDGQVFGITADASTKEGLDKVFVSVDQMLAGLDMLVACAALGADPLTEMAEDDWRYVIETNLVGYLASAQRAITRMEQSGGGHLLFVGSISTEIKAAGESVYSATKAGVQAFAETLRKEISAEKNIKVSVIQPGSVETDMQECTDGEKAQAVEKQQMLHAEEVADAIVWVLTRSANIVNLRIEPLDQKTS
ncbi:SDR family NAD(P)-dependent oxidoreductase [Sphingomonas xinjiangensis]|uniref:NADP-dependent 3-hydroxy acid dehydrogenase YdfG n=1 Tax=Sphingomonas xinjiangensis TaxID=643568 RepID=A0A840YPZ2_9SPHN|nr:SDR family oxidoreductase [Sphingomonas xinjiangensis]MBB5709893.1 NADP-dependent 3-hydroxy acid dehydrogenase YdfG [Sphingomonas xinjiangensis]